MRLIRSLAISVITFLLSASAEAATQRVALMLNGPSCEEDQQAVRHDLEMVNGVKVVDVLSLRGFALLDVEPGTASMHELISAVNEHGKLRQCRAQLMESCISTPQHGSNLHHDIPSP